MSNFSTARLEVASQGNTSHIELGASIPRVIAFNDPGIVEVGHRQATFDRSYPIRAVPQSMETHLLA